jgi:hypothetical protein
MLGAKLTPVTARLRPLPKSSAQRRTSPPQRRRRYQSRPRVKRANAQSVHAVILSEGERPSRNTPTPKELPTSPLEFSPRVRSECHRHELHRIMQTAVLLKFRDLSYFAFIKFTSDNVILSERELSRAK